MIDRSQALARFDRKNECSKEERSGGCDPGRTLKTDLPPLYFMDVASLIVWYLTGRDIGYESEK